MPTLQVIQHADLTPKIRAEILALCTDAYEEDFTPYLQLLGEATHILATESGRLVSHAAWLPRFLRVGNDRVPLRCAYVEAVATPSRCNDLPPSSRTKEKEVKSAHHENDEHEDEQFQRGTDHREPQTGRGWDGGGVSDCGAAATAGRRHPLRSGCRCQGAALHRSIAPAAWQVGSGRLVFRAMPDRAGRFARLQKKDLR